jgi:hypothetical protein
VPVDENSPQPALEKMDKNGVVFLSHVRGLEVFPGIDDKIDSIATKHGFARQVIKTFNDENGRPIFELFQYHPAATPTPESAAKSAPHR